MPRPPARRRNNDGDTNAVPARPGHRNAVHQHDPHAVDRRGAGGQLGSSGDADGARAGWRTSCGITCCGSIRKIRSGPTAIASCSPTAMRRCCCGRCCISPASKPSIPTTRCWASSRSSWRTSAASARSAARRRGIPNTISCPAWRRRPDRWGRASRPASGWRSRKSGLPRATTSPTSRSSTTTSTRSAATAA